MDKFLKFSIGVLCLAVAIAALTNAFQGIYYTFC